MPMHPCTQFIKLGTACRTFLLFNAHPRLCTTVRRQQEWPAAFVAGCADHTLRQTKLHLARGQVGNHDGEPANQCFRGVSGFDAGEYGAGFVAQIEGQLEQFVGAFNMFGVGDAGDAQVDFGEVVDTDERLPG